MKTLIIAMVLLSASYSFADEWTKTDTGLQLLYTGLHVIDWGQTAHEAKEGWHFRHETNLILGGGPKESTVHIYMASTLVGHAVISYILPKPWRQIWQGAGIGIEAWCVGNNYRIGMNGFF